VLPFCYEENPRISLEKKNDEKNRHIHYVFKKVKIKLDMYATGTCTKKLKHYALFASRFEQFHGCFEHTDNLQAG